MERNYELELDSLKNDVSEIRKLLQEITTPKKNPEYESKTLESPNADVDQPERIHKMKNMHDNPHIMSLLQDLESTCEQTHQNGAVTYLGVYESGGRQSTWIRNEVNTDNLLSLIEDKTAEKVLACIGNSDRLNLLLSILKKPMTVSQLVDEAGFNTTGQVYHHLKPLITADLITEDVKNSGRGVYIIQPHRVQGIIMLLAGISDMLDPQYTKGAF